jgi:hypothetical protein
VAPAVLGAPLAMGTPLQQPIMAAPMAVPMMAAPPVCCEQAPMCVQPCVQPCDPCDPCGGVATGYAPAVEGCGCGGTPATMTVAPTVTVPSGTVTVPGPVAE